MGVSVLLISTGSMAGIGAVLSILLILADKKLAVKEDPHLERALAILPGANCGSCGYPQCSAFAAAVIRGDAPVTGLRPGGGEVVEKLSAHKVCENLAHIDHSIHKAPVGSIGRCPAKVIRVSQPVPGYESLFEEEKTAHVAGSGSQ
ncbi:MAG: hypothetical protein DRP87_17625 [Spirochaetes bacterium]|nr:MAG: hypothetical protein DRP87_17625 [Spirochaetota bacterium]